MTDLHSLKAWTIITGIGLILLGGLIAAFAGNFFHPDSGYFKMQAGREIAIVGAVLLIAGVLALYLAITDVRLLNHFLYGP